MIGQPIHVRLLSAAEQSVIMRALPLSSTPKIDEPVATARLAAIKTSRQHFDSPMVRYAFAVVIVAIMTGCRMLLFPLIGRRFAFITFYIAVVASAAFGGAGPAAIAIALSTLAAAFYIFHPADSLGVANPDEQAGLILFVLVSIVLAWMSEAQRRSRLAALRIAAALHESETRLATTLASIGDGVIATDTMGRVTFLNPIAEELTGWPRSDALGKPIQEVFNIVNETTRSVAVNPVQRAIRDGAITGLANHTTLISKNGAERPIDDSGSPIRDLDANVSGAVLVFRDITERRNTELELDRQKTEIEQLNVRLRRSMAETHHRVKNNLQVISALLELPTMDGQESVPASELTRMAHHVQSLGAIHDLLTQSSKTSLGDEMLSADDILKRLLPTLQAMAAGRPIVYEASDVRLPLGQSTSLTMLVNELVSNALKHGRGEIGLRLFGRDDRAVLEVTDRGPGFPDGFDPTLAANTGLELSESLARWDLQGETEYTNRPDGGARVVVRFPVMRQLQPEFHDSQDSESLQ